MSSKRKKDSTSNETKPGNGKVHCSACRHIGAHLNMMVPVDRKRIKCRHPEYTYDIFDPVLGWIKEQMLCWYVNKEGSCDKFEKRED